MPVDGDCVGMQRRTFLHLLAASAALGAAPARATISRWPAILRTVTVGDPVQAGSLDFWPLLGNKANTGLITDFPACLSLTEAIMADKFSAPDDLLENRGTVPILVRPEERFAWHPKVLSLREPLWLAAGRVRVSPRQQPPRPRTCGQFYQTQQELVRSWMEPIEARVKNEYDLRGFAVVFRNGWTCFEYVSDPKLARRWLAHWMRDYLIEAFEIRVDATKAVDVRRLWGSLPSLQLTGSGVLSGSDATVGGHCLAIPDSLPHHAPTYFRVVASPASNS